MRGTLLELWKVLIIVNIEPKLYCTFIIFNHVFILWSSQHKLDCDFGCCFIRIYCNKLMEMIGVWQLTGDIHEEVESHNRVLDRMVHPIPLSLSLMHVNGE